MLVRSTFALDTLLKVIALVPTSFLQAQPYNQEIAWQSFCEDISMLANLEWFTFQIQVPRRLREEGWNMIMDVLKSLPRLKGLSLTQPSQPGLEGVGYPSIPLKHLWVTLWSGAALERWIVSQNSSLESLAFVVGDASSNSSRL